MMIKLTVGESEYEVYIPKFANNKELVEEFQPYVDWDLRVADIYVMDNYDKIRISELSSLLRARGIPKDGFEVILHHTTDDLSQGGKRLVSFKDYVSSQNDTRVSLMVLNEEADPYNPAKFMVDPTLDLTSILRLLKEHYQIEAASSRRIRDLYNKKIYNADDMSKTLEEIRKIVIDDDCNLGENLQLEVGQVPKSEGHLCTVKLDVSDQSGEKYSLQHEFMFTLHDTVKVVLEKACRGLNVKSEDHNLYTCTWADEPLKKLKDLDLTAEQAGLTEDVKLRLMHTTQGTSDEIRTYELYYSASGFPDDLKKMNKIVINENQTLLKLKEAIKEQCTKEFGFETPFEISHMMVRKLNKLNKPCKVLCADNKSIKNLKINCLALMFTIYEKEISPSPNDLRIYIRRRQGTGYRNYKDIVIENANHKVPFSQLKSAIMEKKRLDPEKFEVHCVKYNPKDHLWLRMNQDSANITREPYYVHDGDVIGYLILEKDQPVPKEEDFDTEEDREWRKAISVAGEQSRSTAGEKGFKLDLGF